MIPTNFVFLLLWGAAVALPPFGTGPPEPKEPTTRHPTHKPTAPTPLPGPCTVSGLSFNNITSPAALVSKIFKNAAGRLPVKSTTHADYPSGKVVVIRAAHPEWPANTAVTTPYLQSIFFNVTATKSVAGYFKANSWGALSISGGGLPAWFTLSKKISEYVNGIEANSVYVADCLKQANVNWKALDTNNDGTISKKEAQIVILVPNGPTFASTRAVSPGTVKTPQGTFAFAPRNVVHFSTKANNAADKAVNPIRALAAMNHELSHAFFDLPDYYGANSGTGQYDMMGTGDSNKWVHLTMPVKIKIGWITPKIIQYHRGKCLCFDPSEVAKSALILADDSAPAKLEYWVVEYRNKNSGTGYDDELPDTNGLAVWYVKQGTYSQGHDDVRLVNAALVDQNPNQYKQPGNTALFKPNPAKSRRDLYNAAGQKVLFFQRVGSGGATSLCAEF